MTNKEKTAKGNRSDQVHQPGGQRQLPEIPSTTSTEIRNQENIYHSNIRWCPGNGLPDGIGPGGGARRSGPGQPASPATVHQLHGSPGYPSDYSAVRNVSCLAEGEQVCTALQAGQSQGQQIGRLEGIVSRAEASDVVAAASQFLCPGV